MEEFFLPLFLFNCVMILVDASVGYHVAPLMLAGMHEPEAVASGIKTTRRLLSAVVALYMFFNCVGYFQGRLSYMLAVSGLIAIDLALQLYLRHKSRGGDQDNGDE